MGRSRSLIQNTQLKCVEASEEVWLGVCAGHMI